MKQMENAFVSRNASSHGEDSNCNNQSPEIQLLPMAERMFYIRSTIAETQSQQEQKTITGIDHGVDPLREHGRAASDDSRRKLGDCYR